MPRLANPKSDFTLDVDGVGTFTFGYRTMADEFAIQRKYAELTGGGPITQWLGLVGGWMAALAVLTVKAPDGWVLDELDPLDAAVYEKLSRVFTALKDQEDRFRGRSGVDSQAGGEAAGADH